ncbi:hypothetical protein [Actinokineospora iranica]|nr:hypothetical protein [Actinokineospora iranica]
MTELVGQWLAVRLRTFTSERPDPTDLLTELAFGSRIAREAMSGRWCVIAELLCTGAATSWTQLAAAMGVTPAAARDGFHQWLTNQRDLRRDTGTIGLSDEAATELDRLAGAVAW